MLDSPAIVVANKFDFIQDTDLHKRKYCMNYLKLHSTACGIQFDGEVHGISAGDAGEGLGVLSSAIRSLVEYGEEKRAERNDSVAYF